MAISFKLLYSEFLTLRKFYLNNILCISYKYESNKSAILQHIQFLLVFVQFEIHSCACAVYLLFSCVSRQFIIGIALLACLLIEFYLIPIEQLLHFVEQFVQLEVCLPCSRLLTGIPKLA